MAYPRTARSRHSSHKPEGSTAVRQDSGLHGFTLSRVSGLGGLLLKGDRGQEYELLCTARSKQATPR